MTVNISKPTINIREKLSELDFAKVPFQKMPSGSILQVVSATDTTQRTTTSTSYVTGGNTLSVAITPSSTSSKIYVIVRHYAYNNLTAGLYTIYRDATNLAGGTNYLANYDSDAGTTDGTIVYFFLDSPNTTSSITYQPYMKASSGTTRMGTTASIASITAWEIAG